MSEVHKVPTKQEMRVEMEAGLARFLAAIDQFSEAQMLIHRDAAGWTVRDHLTHLAVWADGIAALLRREDRWAAMGLAIQSSDYADLDFDAVNEQIARQHRDISPEEARTWIIAAQQRIATALNDLSDADLVLPYDQFVPPFTGQGGAPIFEYIRINTSHHYDEHLGWIQVLIGDLSAPE